ncbi:MAG: L,D-transpeptidase family protein [Rhodomicrobium sp.]|nr:L,D-transpeptidase family protein [Rhodomicrobium sp.]
MNSTASRKRSLPLSKPDIKGLKDYYASPEARLIWVSENGLDPAASGALKSVIERAHTFGLDPKDYKIVDGAELTSFSGYPAEWLADAELKMSAAAVSYAGFAQAGRVVPTSIDAEFLDLKPVRPEAQAVLKTLASAPGDIAAQLEAYNPPHPQFAALKKKLAESRAAISSGSAPFAFPTPALGPETYHPQVAILRERFALAPAAGAPRGNPAEYYDEELAEAVRVFQESKGLKADGIVGRETREALNEGTIAVSVNTILSNMERWRWAPRDLGERHIFVNVPEFKFRVISKGKVIHEERIVAGSPKNPTPVFSDEMETVVFNPYWYVPQSILQKEIMPIVQNSLDYLYRNNLEVVWQGRRTVDPYMVDWVQVDPRKVTLRQMPGKGNALGQVKFLFPNRHSVYMHDTPTKHLFDKPVRAYSHGCMRVRDPLKFAKLLLADQGWSEDRIERTLFTAKDEHVKLAKKVPVHISYFTAWVDDDGELHGYRDIYGHDASVRVALKLDRQKVIASKAEDFEIGERGMQN